MKNDTSIDLDSTFAPKQQEQPQPQKQETPKPVVNWNDILTEWSYKLPKGYPTIVDGVFTEYEEVRILNEIMEERFGESLPLPEAGVAKKPDTGNDTSLKEGLVCLFYDVLKSSKAASLIKQLYPKLRDKKQVVSPKDIESLMTIVSSTYDSKGANYGAGKSMPKNLDQYVQYVLTTRIPGDIDTLSNAISAATTIHNEVGNGIIIRNEAFDAIRAKAVELIKQDYNLTLVPDNWCPGDVYLTKSIAVAKKVLQAKSVTIGADSINAAFKKNADSGIVAISLKEEKAQAGKATKFAETVFTNTFSAKVAPFGTSDNKALAKITADVTRFEEYYYGNSKSGKRAQSYQTAIVKDDKIHKSVNNILTLGGFPKIKSKDVTPAKSDALFLKANKDLFDKLIKSIKIFKQKTNTSDALGKVKSNFVSSRDSFIKKIIQQGVQVSAEASTKFATAIQKENEDPSSVFSKKTTAYEKASELISKWTDPNAAISPAYKKIQNITNPFVALTAFAIAEAGISPSFWKVVGKARSLEGHGEFFDAKATVDIDTKTSKIVLVDSVKQAGFMLRYVTILGKDRYDTQLVFRFSGSEFRIEVQRLKKI